MLVQVWKVKKAFKIQVFWKGGKPTFQVCRSCRFVDEGSHDQIVFAASPSRVFLRDITSALLKRFTYVNFILLYFLTVWQIRRVGAENRGVRYTGELLLRHTHMSIDDCSVDVDVLKLCLFVYVSEGHEVPLVPPLPVVYRRGCVRSRFPAIQEVGRRTQTRLTAVQHDL